MDTLRFYVNDELVEVSDLSPTTTLLYFLRGHMGLPGTKEGCNEGDCGACTVVVLEPWTPAGPVYRAVNACLVLLPMVNNRRVYTVEGLERDGDLHMVQRAMVDKLGSQCGYCTPGIVMSLFESVYRPQMEDWQVDDQLAGNLCRCTGYRPIVESAKDVAATFPRDEWNAQRSAAAEQSPDEDLSYVVKGQRFYAPTSFESLFEILEREPDARFVGGATDLGLEVTKKYQKHPCLVSLERIKDLQGLQEQKDGGLHLGSMTKLSDLEDAVQQRFVPIARMLRFFGARQIKNRGTVAGNLCSASPIGDLAPVLTALGARAILRSKSGEREMSLDDFFLGYRQTALKPGEILAQITLPAIPSQAKAIAYKVSKRQELDISTVSAGLYVEVDEAGVVQAARLRFGGVAAMAAAVASKAEAALVGKTWNEATVIEAMAAIKEDFAPIDDHRGSAWYRSTVAANFLLGFFHETQKEATPALPYRPTATMNLEVSP